MLQNLHSLTDFDIFFLKNPMLWVFFSAIIGIVSYRMYRIAVDVIHRLSIYDFFIVFV